MRKNYLISGPSHEAAVDSLVDEVGAVVGTQGVDVDISANTMTVTGENFADQHILDAAEAAGFRLVGDLAL
ncbi:hypothetical protein [Corynebacterium timonense]|uniref:Copper chaperone CopZ n=1 Tax=Corynebacterium timonense TaxID=441500 RepID=A0A1H1UUE3_9CORY|nr:hypothetical protein [Corynebacterium timonense]SDS76162.1 hypothetical protein SAMN04488539_2335 [Corynebacterium timonense]